MAMKEPDMNNLRLRRGLFTLCHIRGNDILKVVKYIYFFKRFSFLLLKTDNENGLYRLNLNRGTGS
jgi:hypothetical protein